jgi:hypothetical protein
MAANLYPRYATPNASISIEGGLGVKVRSHDSDGLTTREKKNVPANGIQATCEQEQQRC